MNRRDFLKLGALTGLFTGKKIHNAHARRPPQPVTLGEDEQPEKAVRLLGHSECPPDCTGFVGVAQQEQAESSMPAGFVAPVMRARRIQAQQGAGRPTIIYLPFVSAEAMVPPGRRTIGGKG